MNYPTKTAKILAVFEVFEKHYQKIPLEIFANSPYKNLVATLVSSRTRDETTLVASRRLFKIAPDIKTLGQLEIRLIMNSIYPVAFYRIKAKNLKKTAQILIKEYRGEIPKTLEELTKLPGVGRKTANIVLSASFNQPAISVDTHVHKIANLLGWVKTKTPEQTERELMKVIPKKYWSRVNRLFVSIGRQFRSKRKLLEFFEEKRLLA